MPKRTRKKEPTSYTDRGRKIAAVRRLNDMNQSEFASFLRNSGCEIQQQAISHWECGISTPDASAVSHIARIGGVCMEWITDNARPLGELPTGTAQYPRHLLEQLKPANHARTGASRPRHGGAESWPRPWPGSMACPGPPPATGRALQRAGEARPRGARPALCCLPFRPAFRHGLVHEPRAEPPHAVCAHGLVEHTVN